MNAITTQNNQAGIRGHWERFKIKHPLIAQFLIFYLFSNAVTILQLILMPVFKGVFAGTGLVAIPFQIFPVGYNVDGSRYYIFNYAAGTIAADGTGGGLAYFLAVQITLAIAQVINFFAQRNITFKSTGSIGRAAFWYVAAYIVITLAAGALQGLYKAPIYHFLMNAMGNVGETIADIITMIINSAISFWVFFPIFKIIFKSTPKSQETEVNA
jgi:putative flippase GtrA